MRYAGGTILELDPLSRVVSYSQIAANIAQVIVLVAVSATLFAAKRQANAASESLKLLAASNQFQAFKAIVEESRSLKSIRDELEQAHLPTYKELLKKHRSAHGVKAAPELANLFRLGGFYEEVGVLVRYDFVDFTLVFDMVPFPDRLWESARSILHGLRADWAPDFWANWEYLFMRYQDRRQANQSVKRI